LVGDRGMIRADQKAQAHAADFHYITALTKPQIQKLLRSGTFQLELFEEQINEVEGPEQRRYVLRRNPVRAQELERGREEKKALIIRRVREANEYLAGHRRATVRIQKKKLQARIGKLKVEKWLSVAAAGRKLKLKTDAQALAQESQLDGCYVIESDLKVAEASAQTLHDRYKDLAQVEADFRTMKTAHLEIRPWHVRKEENTRARALTSMLALKVRRHLAGAWRELDVTVEEGVEALGQITVDELVASQTGQVVSRTVPEPGELQAKLLAALDLELPVKAPEAKVQVVTRVKLQDRRKRR